jgi:peptide chain release factor 2
VSAQADFWNNPDEAEKIMKQIQARKGWTSSFESLDTKIQDLEVLFEFFTAGEVSEEELKKTTSSARTQ